MRKKISLAIIIILLVSFAALPAHADGPVKKLGRGLCNIVTCPLELSKGIQDTHMESGLFAALTYGIIRGFVNTGIRLGVGCYEVVTFPVPIPGDYEPILTDPEFFGEDMML